MIDRGPRLSLNGTDPKELMAQRLAVMDALRAAEQALAAMYPNGRDYIDEPDAFRQARDEHEGWQQQVRAIREAVHVQALAIREQQDAREARRAGR